MFLSVFLTIITPFSPLHGNHSNLNSTIIALELSSTVEQIRSIVGNPEDENFFVNNNKYIRSVYFDFLYIVSYSSFFIMLFEIGSRKYSPGLILKRLFYFFLLIAIIFDIVENIKLLNVLGNLTKILTDEDVYLLKNISLTKWISIFVLCGINGLLFWLPKKNYLLKAAGLFLFVSFMLSLLGIFKLRLIEVAALVMTEGFIIAYIHIALKSFMFLKNK
ncbi:MAG: hypothetical protein H7A23_10625 [Leptospiraceae bacterium]|nr:hypothetical protein [Leptospiraceae bacterium]MCP5494999.1 hypothetical protein [Leptospiraceae bacterium]